MHNIGFDQYEEGPANDHLPIVVFGPKIFQKHVYSTSVTLTRFIYRVSVIYGYFDVYLLDYTLLCLIGIIPISHIHTIHLYKYMDMLGGLNSIDKLICIT